MFGAVRAKEFIAMKEGSNTCFSTFLAFLFALLRADVAVSLLMQKVLLTFSFCHRMKQLTSINRVVLQHLLEAVRTKRLKIWTNKFWILHHDKAPAHTAPSIRQYWAKKLNKFARGIHFENVETIKRAVTMKLKAIPVESFQGSVDAWKKRRKTCIRFEGDYFEVENV